MFSFGRNSRFIHNLLFRKAKKNPAFLLHSQTSKLCYKSIASVIFLSAYPYVNCELDVNKPHYEKTSTERYNDHLRKSCVNAVSAVIKLIDDTSVAVFNAFTEYKTCLTELISTLETFEMLDKYSAPREKAEDAIIAARAKLIDCEKEFSELKSIFENVFEVASAMSQFSYLLGYESSALSLFDAVSSLQITINENIQEIKELENKRLQLERNLIVDSTS